MGWTALLDESDKETGEFVGDEPWDILGIAYEKIIVLYNEKFGRPPTKDELYQITDFAFPDDELLSKEPLR